MSPVKSILQVLFASLSLLKENVSIFRCFYYYVFCERGHKKGSPSRSIADVSFKLKTSLSKQYLSQVELITNKDTAQSMYTNITSACCIQMGHAHKYNEITIS